MDTSNLPFGKRKAIRLEGQKMRELRRRVFERDGYRCVLCGSTSWLELSHIVSRGRLGDDSESNTRVLCKLCHVQYDHHGQPAHL